MPSRTVCISPFLFSPSKNYSALEHWEHLSTSKYHGVNPSMHSSAQRASKGGCLCCKEKCSQRSLVDCLDNVLEGFKCNFQLKKKARFVGKDSWRSIGKSKMVCNIWEGESAGSRLLKSSILAQEPGERIYWGFSDSHQLIAFLLKSLTNIFDSM